MSLVIAKKVKTKKANNAKEPSVSLLLCRRDTLFLMELWTSNLYQCIFHKSSNILGALRIPLRSVHEGTDNLAKRTTNERFNCFQTQTIPVGSPKVSALCNQLARSQSDPHLLIAPHVYGVAGSAGAGLEQPFSIIVHPQVSLICDVHSHLCESEVIGLLAGYWDEDSNSLQIAAPFPCTSTSRHEDDGTTDVELDPAAELIAREAILKLGLNVVGWYHSHPRFRPDPSVTDIHNQAQYQKLLRNETSGAEPFVGLIVSSFDVGLTSTSALHQWFHTIPFAFDTNRVKKIVYVPMKLSIATGAIMKIDGCSPIDSSHDYEFDNCSSTGVDLTNESNNHSSVFGDHGDGVGTTYAFVASEEKSKLCSENLLKITSSNEALKLNHQSSSSSAVKANSLQDIPANSHSMVSTNNQPKKKTKKHSSQGANYEENVVIAENSDNAKSMSIASNSSRHVNMTTDTRNPDEGERVVGDGARVEDGNATMELIGFNACGGSELFDDSLLSDYFLSSSSPADANQTSSRTPLASATAVSADAPTTRSSGRKRSAKFMSSDWDLSGNDEANVYSRVDAVVPASKSIVEARKHNHDMGRKSQAMPDDSGRQKSSKDKKATSSIATSTSTSTSTSTKQRKTSKFDLIASFEATSNPQNMKLKHPKSRIKAAPLPLAPPPPPPPPPPSNNNTKEKRTKKSKHHKKNDNKHPETPHFVSGPACSLLQLLQGSSAASVAARELFCQAGWMLKFPMLVIAQLCLFYSAHIKRVDFEKKWKDIARLEKVAASVGKCLEVFAMPGDEIVFWSNKIATLIQLCWKESPKDTKKLQLEYQKEEQLVPLPGIATYYIKH